MIKLFSFFKTLRLWNVKVFSNIELGFALVLEDLHSVCAINGLKRMSVCPDACLDVVHECIHAKMCIPLYLLTITC